MSLVWQSPRRWEPSAYQQGIPTPVCALARNDGYYIDLNFVVGGVVADLDGALEHVQTADGGQALDDALPAAFHVGIHLALAVLGAAALAVDQALGAGGEGADAAGEVQVALAALVAVMLQGSDTLVAGQGIGVAAGADTLAGQVRCHGLHADTAGQHQNGVSLFNLGGIALQAKLHIFGIADVIGGQDAGDDTLGSQFSLKLVGGLLGEVYFLTAMAVDDKHLSVNDGTEGFLGF